MNPVVAILGTVISFACAVAAAWLAGRADPAELRRFKPVALTVAFASAAACSYATSAMTDVLFWNGGLAKFLGGLGTSLGLEVVWVALQSLLAGLAAVARRFAADPIYSVMRYFTLSMLGITVFYFLLTVMDVSGIAKQGGA